jgi:ribosomal protein L21E
MKRFSMTDYKAGDTVIWTGRHFVENSECPDIREGSTGVVVPGVGVPKETKGSYFIVFDRDQKRRVVECSPEHFRPYKLDVLETTGLSPITEFMPRD